MIPTTLPFSFWICWNRSTATTEINLETLITKFKLKWLLRSIPVECRTQTDGIPDLTFQFLIFFTAIIVVDFSNAMRIHQLQCMYIVNKCINYFYINWSTPINALWDNQKLLKLVKPWVNQKISAKAVEKNLYTSVKSRSHFDDESRLHRQVKIANRLIQLLQDPK